ncbi:MAG: tetratricopeptide repeat protein [Bryobacteraceae bacterium]|nr:tetratricopeptide repeat protein [Bryobacteraceae bacterium]
MNPFERLKEIVQVFGLAGNEDETTWFDASNPFCRDAERLLKAGRAAEAEEMFARVLREPQYAAVVRRQHARILLALATARLRQQKWDEARDAALQARAMLSDPRSRASLDFADCCRILGQASRGVGALEEALQYLLEGIAAYESQKAPKPAGQVERRLEAASLLREMNRAEHAEQQAREAVKVAGERLPGQKEEGDAWIELAQCLTGAGRFAEARQAGERAVSIHRAACGDFSSELAEDYEKLGSICQKQQDYQAAVAYLEKALGVRDRQVGGDTSQLGLLLVALADLYALLGRLAPALELLQQAVGKLGPAKDANLGDALEKLGAIYVRTGRYEDAADCYRRACDIWAAAPELYGERIAADVRALEDLRGWLPEPQSAPVPELPDSGISVLREAPAPGPGATGGAWSHAAGRLAAALRSVPHGKGGSPGAGTPPGLSPAGASSPSTAAGGLSASPANRILGLPGGPHPGAPGRGFLLSPEEGLLAPDGPLAPSPPASGSWIAGAEDPQAGRPEYPLLRTPVTARGVASGSAPGGQVFWGWEELEFETLRV